MASFRCYSNSDVIATLITTNFHLYLIQLWWQFFQMFVYGDVVYAQTWQVLTLKNCIEPFSYASTAYVVASALVSVRPICKNLSNLQKIFGQMVYRPPWPTIARTPMIRSNESIFLELPDIKTHPTLGDRAFQSAAPYLWNALPSAIRNMKTLDTFKTAFKTHFSNLTFK